MQVKAKREYLDIVYHFSIKPLSNL